MKEYYDNSTLDLDAIRKLPVYEGSLVRRCHVTSDYPPGHPTYFMQDICGSSTVTVIITAPGVEGSRVITVFEYNIEFGKDEFDKLVSSLWKPLPLDNPRVRMWVRGEYRYFGSCYNKDKSPETRRDFHWPIPAYELKASRFTGEPGQKDKDDYIEVRRPHAIPENHRAVLNIRKFYPDYEPDLELIENPPSEGPVGYDLRWWKRYCVQPRPEQCDDVIVLDSGVRKHHTLAGICRTCGNVGEEEAKPGSCIPCGIGVDVQAKDITPEQAIAHALPFHTKDIIDF